MDLLLNNIIFVLLKVDFSLNQNNTTACKIVMDNKPPALFRLTILIRNIISGLIVYFIHSFLSFT